VKQISLTTLRRISFWLVILCLSLCFEPPAVSAQGWLNIRVNADTTLELQNEEQIAINPVNPDNMVAVWRDFRLGFRQVGWGYTFDGGATWTDGGLFVEPNFEWQSDPGVTTDKDGNFYAVVLSSQGFVLGNGLYVFKSTDGGVSWGPPLEVISHFPNAFEDKEFIACDRTDGPHSGNLYVVWARFLDTGGAFTTHILLRRSTDAGVTWGGTVPVGDSIDVQYPIPVVGRHGEVYVAWSGYDEGTGANIKVDVSLDGGMTFGADSNVTDVVTTSRGINGGIVAYSSPHMDADITDGSFSGRLYMAFMDDRNGLGDPDIWVAASDDTAQTWSTPVRINDDPEDNGRDQFHPWLTVDNTGTVTVVFLDRRDDPGNLLYHCYLTQSTDGGATWSANVQVSTQPSDPGVAFLSHTLRQEAEAVGAGFPHTSVLRAGLLGEYIGVTAWNGIPTPIWTDTRNGHQDVFAGHFSELSAVPDDGAPRFGAVQNYPNPFNPSTVIQYSVPHGARVSLNIYSIEGELVRNLIDQKLPKGDYRVPWDGTNNDGTQCASGVYYYSLSLDGKLISAKKAVLLK
jgi:hypothetical protein